MYNYAHLRCSYVSAGNLNAGKEVTKKSILDISPVIFADIEVQIGWFQWKRLVAENPNCSVCNNAMVMQVCRDVEDFRHH